MKTHIDFFETFKGEFLASKRFMNRFIKYWGIEEVDGVKVMKKRFYVYPNTLTDNTIRKLTKMLGAWSQIKEADFTPIKKYYLWFDTEKDVNNTTELNAEILANKVEEYCPKDKWQKATINYIDKVNPTRFDGYSKEQILAYIDNDYRNIFNNDNGFVVGDTITESSVGKYVLFDDGTEFEVKTLSSQTTSITPTIANGGAYQDRWDQRTRYTGLSIEIRFRRISESIDPEGLFITSFIEEQDEYRKSLVKNMQNSTSYDTPDNYTVPVVTDDIWYKSQLRHSIVVDSNIKTKDRIRYILTFLNTGQVKKSVPWYKKVLGLVLVIIAIVVAVTTSGAGAPISTVLTSMALYVGITVLIMSLVQAKWAKNNAAAAEYMGRWIKVGNIISMLVGVSSVISNLSNALAEQAAKEAATASIASASGISTAQASVAVASMSVAEVAAYNVAMGVAGEITATTVINVAKDMAVSWLGSTWESISMRMVSVAVKFRQDDMKSDLQSKTTQNRELEEELKEDADNSMHIALEDIKRYTDNTDRIWTRYDYDALYGPTPTTMHIGNVQKASSYKGTGLNLRAEDLM